MMNFLYNTLFIDFSTIILLISIGAFLRFNDIINESNLEFLNTFILRLMIPCFIISSFMKDLDDEYITNGLNIIIWAIIIQFILFVLSIVFFKYFQPQLPHEDKIALTSILPLGNVTFYGVAINSMIYGNAGVFVTNIYALVNRIFLNSIGLATMSGLRFNKHDFIRLLKNPTIQCTLIGSMIFFFQEYTPQLTINDTTASIFRLDHSVPFLFKSIQKIGNLLGTFAWLIIGSSITKESLSMIAHSPYSIIFSIQKTIIIPFIGIGIYIIAHQIFGLSINHKFLPATLMLLITPVANTLIIFSLKYKRSPNLCISCMVMSTIFSLCLFPFYKLLFIYLIDKAII